MPMMSTTKLPLIQGARWHGHLTILQRRGDDYVVDFDAVDPSAREERCVMDRAVLTPKQLLDWTGWRETS